jgi:hypothetical protein
MLLEWLVQIEIAPFKNVYEVRPTSIRCPTCVLGDIHTEDCLG